MLDKIGRYEFLAEPFHCDFSQRLFMGHLGNHMLNAADFHSNDRGFGMKYLLSVKRAWVLSRLAIEMNEMPEMYTRFYVETWVESAMRYFTNRSFRVVGTDGKEYGFGRSIWAMIDTETRQPCNLFDVNNGAIVDYVEKDKENPMDKLSRVKMDDQAERVHTIDTYYNDVDINGHINSIKYIEHVLDLWNLDWYRTHRIGRFDIAYVAECHQGDQLSFYRENVNVEGQDHDSDTFCIRIVKHSPDTPEPIEVCRSKVVFKTV